MNLSVLWRFFMKLASVVTAVVGSFLALAGQYDAAASATATAILTHLWAKDLD